MQGETLLRSTGTHVTRCPMGPGSAVHHFVARPVRGTRQSLRRRRDRHLGMGAVGDALTAFRQREQPCRHHHISQRHARCDAEAAADADGFAVHEAEISHDRTGQREG